MRNKIIGSIDEVISDLYGDNPHKSMLYDFYSKLLDHHCNELRQNRYMLKDYVKYGSKDYTKDYNTIPNGGLNMNVNPAKNREAYIKAVKTIQQKHQEEIENCLNKMKQYNE